MLIRANQKKWEDSALYNTLVHSVTSLTCPTIDLFRLPGLLSGSASCQAVNCRQPSLLSRLLVGLCLIVIMIAI